MAVIVSAEAPNMTEIKHAEELKQAEVIRKLERLQAKARRRKRSISLHGFPKDNQSEGTTDDLPDYMRPINGRYC